MRILLDECVDERLRHSFPAHDCQTAHFLGFAGLKNGALLSAAENAGFDVILTVDQHMPDQQSFIKRRIALLILCAPSSRLADLRQLAGAATAALASIGPGQVATVRNPRI
jgi:predicted nuclease of predicted toxin-antitoxin system